MRTEMEQWFLDFNEQQQQWHIDTERVPGNAFWINIGYGNEIVINHFCDMVDMMRREFGLNFTTKQIIRLAECTPWLTVHSFTPLPDDEYQQEWHMTPIHSKERIESNTEWKSDEEEPTSPFEADI